MTDAQQREAARKFFYRWQKKGKEDEDARSYWIEILSDILGVEDVTNRVSFEKKVIGSDGNTKRIDVYIPETHVLIEQKSLGIALDKPQAGHGGMTPYEHSAFWALCSWLTPPRVIPMTPSGARSSWTKAARPNMPPAWLPIR